MNRDHWLLYLTSPNTQPLLPSDSSLSSSFHLSLPSPSLLQSSSSSAPSTSKARIVYEDTTLEILMSHLSPQGRQPFFPETSAEGHVIGKQISENLGIDTLFPGETVLDSYGFDPCGYSANGVVGSGLRVDHTKDNESNGGYFTIHVTPEEGWSYASFECNVPLTPSTSSSLSSPSSPSSSTQLNGHSNKRPDLKTLIKKVVNIFQPNRLSITLFVSTPPSTSSSDDPMSIGNGNDMEERTPAQQVESQAWNAFRGDLLGKEYERKDRIGYEFDGYDLIFACFERRGWKDPGKIVNRMVNGNKQLGDKLEELRLS